MLSQMTKALGYYEPLLLSGCSGLHPVPIACGGALRAPCDFVYIISHRRSGLY